LRVIKNPLKGKGLTSTVGMAEGEILVDPSIPLALFSLCPAAHKTILTKCSPLAGKLGVDEIYLKDERSRLDLGSFKALGAAYAIAKLAAESVKSGLAAKYEDALSGQTFVCASAGNHGLSLAAGARLFGADAVVYLSDTVPENFANRLRGKSAKVVRYGENYEVSMAAAKLAAETNGWALLSDSSWAGYGEPARDVMEGYLIMGAEVAEQIERAPTHIFLQAGVGGLAAACCASAREYWGAVPQIIVVEPEYAPALINSIEADTPVVANGPISNMGRLDCKEPSHLALKYLAGEADYFMTISEDEAVAGVAMLSECGIISSPSGAAGLSGLLSAQSCFAGLGIGRGSRILAYITEGPADGDG